MIGARSRLPEKLLKGWKFMHHRHSPAAQAIGDKSLQHILSSILNDERHCTETHS